MSKAESDDEPNPDDPRPVRWKRYKLRVNRKEHAVRASSPLPADPPRNRTSGRTVVWIILLVLGIPAAGCMLFACLARLGFR
ncbi:MAG: hypothetical protein U0791_27280 [Gemmataceae bacterium]